LRVKDVDPTDTGHLDSGDALALLEKRSAADVQRLFDTY